MAGWILPSATLVLLPKCPVCVAAYVSMVSGVGISFASASILRNSLLVLSISALLGLMLKRCSNNQTKKQFKTNFTKNNIPNHHD